MSFLQNFDITKRTMKTPGGIVSEYAMLILVGHPHVNSGWISTEIGNRLEPALREALEHAIRREFMEAPATPEPKAATPAHVFPTTHLQALRDELDLVSGVRTDQIEQIGRIQARICPGTGYRSRRSRAAARAVRAAYQRAEPAPVRRFDYAQ